MRKKLSFLYFEEEEEEEEEDEEKTGNLPGERVLTCVNKGQERRKRGGRGETLIRSMNKIYF